MRITELEIQEYTAECRREIGWRIQDRRLAMGLRAVDMAAYLGIGTRQVGRIENGNANCTVTQLYVLAQLLECSVDYLLFGVPKAELTEAQQQAIDDLLTAFGKKRL